MNLKDFLLHKLTVRLIYMIGALAIAHTVSFLTKDAVQQLLSNIFVNPSLKPGADKYLEAMLSTWLMIAGEFVFHFFHKKWILPEVSKNTPAKGASL